MTVSIDEIMAELSEDERAELISAAKEQAKGQVFFPTPKQQMVVESEADIIGYGGAAGGGKSYLLTGLAATKHLRSSITRPQKNQCQKFVDELAKMLGSRDGYASQTSTFRFTAEGNNRFVHFFGLDNPGDEEKQQGDDYDLKGYDEVTQMREADIRYTLTWNRTDVPGQRVRAVLTFNPPTTAEGRWVVKFFAPWLDPQHPNPARDGELRWYATVGDNQDYEVAGPQPFVLKRNGSGQLVPWYSFTSREYGPEDIIHPKSRTFIRALVTDNPYYMKTGYMKELQALPEPLRSQMLKGDFMAGVEDDAHQLIPTAWIDEAMARGAAILADTNYKLGPLDSLGVDVARGGNMGSQLGATGHDEMVISKRYGAFFAPLVVHKGVAIDDGAKSAALTIAERRDDAPIHVDVIGVGTSTYDFLNQQNQHVLPINGSAASLGTAGVMRFANLRAELHWRMREALDPLNPDKVALPPDQKLAIDLAAPRWRLMKQGIVVESKDDIKKRLGRSPDRGDAVILANISTAKRKMIIGGYHKSELEILQQTGMSYEERRMKELE
jgi:hypothetical protein